MKLLLGSLITLIALLSQQVHAQLPESLDDFRLGTHYEIIRAKPSENRQLTEHFSLYCVHCFKGEPLFSQLKDSLGEGISFNRSHVIFLPQSKPQWAKNMTFAFAAARELDIEDKIVANIFDYHFVQNVMLGEMDDIRDIFSINGVSKKQFEQTISSPAVLERVQAMVDKAQNDRVRFTPDLIVNDKYRVLLASVGQSKSPQQELSRLVNYLLTNP